MADILIRGISLPEGELKYVTLWVYGDGRVYVSNNASAASSQRLQDLAVPLPEGHGRLIDAEAVVKTICNSCDGQCEVVQCDCLNCKADCRCDIVKEISDAPTIVPAEGENTDDN